jgi:hypothetical protein
MPLNDPGTEADWLDTFDGNDFDEENREETEQERMCRYHDIEEHDLLSLYSNNEIAQMWWNYRKFGKNKPEHTW